MKTLSKKVRKAADARRRQADKFWVRNRSAHIDGLTLAEALELRKHVKRLQRENQVPARVSVDIYEVVR